MRCSFPGRIPVSTTYLYNICTTSAQRLVQYCYTNVLWLLGCICVDAQSQQESPRIIHPLTLKAQLFPIWNHHNCLGQLFPLHLNTYVMGHGHYYVLLLLVRGSTSDVRIWRLWTSKVGPRAKRVLPCTARAVYVWFQAVFNPNVTVSNIKS